MPAQKTCDVGMIGLGVMGQNLAMNMADHGYNVAVYNRTYDVTEQFMGEHGNDPYAGGSLVPFEDLKDFVKGIRAPRVIVVLVKAGPPVDAVCDALIEAGAKPDDIVVDGGNSLWTDTITREKKYRGKISFFGSGVSGGEVGARFGPSLMPGGDTNAWQRLKPIWEKIAAKVDPKTGKPIETFAVGKPVTTGEPCTTYIGPDGAGHYVKMVHNGIEYADMQLIGEAYHILRSGLKLPTEQLASIFAEWNTGDLDSYLIEITADILQQRDPITGQPMVDVILDRAGQKGTGKWTAVNALDMGIPAVTIAEAVFARAMSASKEERRLASKTLRGPGIDAHEIVKNEDDFINAVHDALYCSKICAYAQGFQLMREAQKEYNWNLDFGGIAKIWRGGCIIRARFLQKITDAYQRDPKLANLLLDPYFREHIEKKQESWRRVIATTAQLGIPNPAFSSALAYYDGYRTERLPASLLQAQRDYFGAHTYERVDQPGGKFFHLDWPQPKPERVQVEV